MTAYMQLKEVRAALLKRRMAAPAASRRPHGAKQAICGLLDQCLGSLFVDMPWALRVILEQLDPERSLSPDMRYGEALVYVHELMGRAVVPCNAPGAARAMFRDEQSAWEPAVDDAGLRAIALMRYLMAPLVHCNDTLMINTFMSGAASEQLLNPDALRKILQRRSVRPGGVPRSVEPLFSFCRAQESVGLMTLDECRALMPTYYPSAYQPARKALESFLLLEVEDYLGRTQLDEADRRRAQEQHTLAWKCLPWPQPCFVQDGKSCKNCMSDVVTLMSNQMGDQRSDMGQWDSHCSDWPWKVLYGRGWASDWWRIVVSRLVAFERHGESPGQPEPAWEAPFDDPRDWPDDIPF